MKVEHSISIFAIQFLAVFISCSAEEKQTGHWGEWGAMSPCSVTCGSGLMSMERVWIPGPADPPSNEPWTSTQVFSCTDETFPECPQDGQWSGWGAWSGCTKQCGGGNRERHRECRGQTYGGKKCDGEKFDKEDCNREPCPLLPRNFDMSQCQEKANFTCASKKMCIPLSQKCDKTVHCHDGSDEEGCPIYSGKWDGVRYDLSRDGAPSLYSKVAVITGSVFSVILIFVLH